jgi:hypothetical protein
MPAGGAAGLGQLKELHASGLIDTDTFNMIEATMTNASAQLEQLHASGVMSDEVYAQAMASRSAATSGSGPSVDAAELELLQHGESAPSPPPGDLKVGDFLPVKVDPADPWHVAIDWTTFGT